MNTGSKNNRIAWVDMAKGYGIILVILGHIGFGRFGDWIYSFHLPLFVFLSGYVFKTNYGWKVFIAKISKSLLMPYFCFAIIVFVCEHYPFSGLTLKDVSDFAVGILLQKRFKFIWFLLYLYLIELIFYTVTRLTVNKWVILIACVLFTVIGHIYNVLYGTPMIWNLDAVFFSMLFFCLGYFYRLYGDILLKSPVTEKIRILIAVVSMVVSLITVFLAGNRLELFDAVFGGIGLSYISAISGIIFVTTISKLVSIGPLMYIGKNSLSYYLTHLYISIPISIQILTSFGIAMDNGNRGIVVVTVKLIMLILTIVVSTTFDYLYKNIKRKVMAVRC